MYLLLLPIVEALWDYPWATTSGISILADFLQKEALQAYEFNNESLLEGTHNGPFYRLLYSPYLLADRYFVREITKQSQLLGHERPFYCTFVGRCLKTIFRRSDWVNGLVR